MREGGEWGRRREQRREGSRRREGLGDGEEARMQ